MRRALLTVLLSAMLVAFVGCTTYTSVAPRSTVPLEDLATTATYDVIGPAQGTSSGGMLFGFIRVGGEKKNGVVAGSRPIPNPVLRAAIYNSIESVPGADALLAPRWSIESKNYFIYSELTATVKGKALRFNRSGRSE
ncbi:MAG: hypothetical protein QGH74_01210 [Candidatus Brocadiia bacterium]|jgi:hypothetical protein|nr:hypothetical protein [Candidatus Brocadiia bacterium]